MEDIPFGDPAPAGLRDGVVDESQTVRDVTWVQCEHPDCLKWRKISVFDAEQLTNDPWYCQYNPDPTFASCSVKEEDYESWVAWVDAEGMTFSVVESQMLGPESEPTGSDAENPVTRQGRVSRKPARFLN